MERRVIAAMMVATVMATPARSQTILDTMRQLRSTVRQLGGKPKTADSVPTDPTAVSQGDQGLQKDDKAMVPTTVLVDDRSDTKLAATALVPRRVATFDVRGLKLGMSPREVGSIADGQHFRRRWNSQFGTTGSFEVEATALANRQLDKAVDAGAKTELKYTQAFDPEGDELKCEFTLEPSGPKLSRIEYRAKLDGLTQAQAQAALARKYGLPTGNLDDVMLRSWSNATKFGDGSSPSLYSAIDAGMMSLTLSQSSDYTNAAQRRLLDRAQQIAAARGGGVRF